MMTDIENMLVAYLRQRGPVKVEEIAEHLGQYMTQGKRKFTRSGIRNVIMRINAKMPDNARIIMVQGGRGKGKAVYQLTSLKQVNGARKKDAKSNG